MDPKSAPVAVFVLCPPYGMNNPETQPVPIALAQADPLAMIEPRTGPLSDLRFRVVDERGAFEWTATLAGTGEVIAGTCTRTLVTDGVNI